MWGSRLHVTLQARNRTLAFPRRWEPLEGLGEKEGCGLTYILEGAFWLLWGKTRAERSIRKRL